jgi:hypothetical protein
MAEQEFAADFNQPEPDLRVENLVPVRAVVHGCGFGAGAEAGMIRGAFPRKSRSGRRRLNMLSSCANEFLCEADGLLDGFLRLDRQPMMNR